MSLNKSKVCLIESHEWGGQIFLRRYPFEKKLTGYSMLQSDRDEILNNRLNGDAYDLFMILQPVTDATTIGEYNLLTCSINGYDANGKASFEVKGIVLLENGNLNIKPFLPDTTYDTKWNVISIPNINNTAGVFLLKLKKANDNNNNKYLSLDVIPSTAREIVTLTFTNSITSRKQLWTLQML